MFNPTPSEKKKKKTCDVGATQIPRHGPIAIANSEKKERIAIANSEKAWPLYDLARREGG